MRLLHEITPDETVVASGEYQYIVDGKPTGQVEKWQISRLPNNIEIVRSDIGGGSEDSPNLLTHLRRHPDGRPEWLRLRFGRGKLAAAAHYTFEDDVVRGYRQAEGGLRRQDAIDIATGFEVDYHTVVAHDYVWRGYPAHARGKKWAIQVFSPDLWADDDEVLIGRALRFTVTPLDPEPCVIPLGEIESSRPYEIVLSDGVKAMAWFDEFGIPLRWYYPEKAYDFVLSSYTRA